MIRMLALAVAATACASPTAATVPGFVHSEMRGAHAARAKLYLAVDGSIRKHTLYVTREAIPDWVHAMADEKLGAGPEESFEIEQYENGDQVYEVTRLVDGHPTELAVRTDKTVKYVETWLDPTELPEATRTAMEGIAGFELLRASVKRGPGLEQIQVRGRVGELERRLVFSATGELQHNSRVLPAKLEVDL